MHSCVSVCMATAICVASCWRDTIAGSQSDASKKKCQLIRARSFIHSAYKLRLISCAFANKIWHWMQRMCELRTKYEKSEYRRTETKKSCATRNEPSSHFFAAKYDMSIGHVLICRDRKRMHFFVTLHFLS